MLLELWARGQELAYNKKSGGEGNFNINQE